MLVKKQKVLLIIILVLYFLLEWLVRSDWLQIIVAMRMLYQKAKLVHTDLSEFNILYFEVKIAMNTEIRCEW